MLFTTCGNVLSDLWFRDQLVPICVHNAVLIPKSTGSLYRGEGGGKGGRGGQGGMEGIQTIQMHMFGISLVIFHLSFSHPR